MQIKGNGKSNIKILSYLTKELRPSYVPIFE